MLDNVDELILSALSINSRQDSKEIWNFLRGYGYNPTEEEIESRITRLEAEGIITGYTISVDTTKIKRRVVRVVLVTFRTSQHLPRRLEGLKKYLAGAPFVLYSGRTRGGYDLICIQAFPSEERLMRKVIFIETYLETSYNHMKYMILYQPKIPHSILLHTLIKITKNS